MGFEDVVFLPSQARSYIRFLNDCGRGLDLGTATCLNTGAGGRQRHAPCKMFFLQRIQFLCHF